MATTGIRELRHKYKAAYTTYMHGVQRLSDASQNGVLPSDEVLKLEGQAFNELTNLRAALLDALRAHSRKTD